MLEKIGPVKNPLTIIAIFAGIAEVSGTIVLPFLADSNQSIFIWFLMLFPSALVILFFWTLNCNHKVLYAPSDYANQDHFVATWADRQLGNPTDGVENKVKEELPVRITIERKEFSVPPLKYGE
jgi:hypothetical protein